MKNKYLFIAILALAIISCTQKKQYHFTIVDDVSGEQLSARIAVIDNDGKAMSIDGNPTMIEYLNKHWCYTDGSFSITSGAENIELEVQRGFETLPVKVSVDKRKKNQVIKLQRWTNMQQKGYMCGDIHIHSPFPKEALPQIKAEDLNVVNVLVVENSKPKMPFILGIDSASGPEHFVSLDQEVRDWQMGHITLLGLSSLVNGYSIVGGVNSLINNNNPHRLLAHAMDETHRQGGLVAWSHFSNLPGAEVPIAVALGKIDAIELLTFDDPTHLPSHRSPWSNSGFSQAEFPLMRGMDIYYQFLNAGFQLPIVAGTDKPAMIDLPIGSNRYYGFTNGDISYEAWLHSIKNGTGFITNSPILTFNVNDHSSGDIIDFNNTQKVHIEVEAQSLLPFTSVEIVVNGKVVKQKSALPENNPPVNGLYVMNLELDMVLDKSCWISARVVDPSNFRVRILPRDLTVFAHTNPVYFLKEGKKVKEKASVEYLQKYVQGTINWLQTNPVFNNPEDAAEALRLAKKAYKIYESL
jgi:hypothetical protein